MTKGMIVSLGGSPGPVAHTIQHHRPDVVCLLASQESVDLVSKVKEGLSYQPVDRKVLVQNPNDLLACFRDSLDCWDILIQQGVTPEDVLIDFTGGTKVMSAALVLLGVQKGCRFSYIGGGERTKGGLGTVVTGSEQVFEGANPWEVLAIAEGQLGISHFNQLRFSAACDTFKNGYAKVQQVNKPLAVLFGILAALSEAYQGWESFQHKSAYSSLQGISEQLANYIVISGDRGIEPLLGRIKSNLDFLKEMQAQSQGFRKPCRAYVLDLIANGQRRAEASSFDDAVLRLYRTLEMQAQVQLQTKHKIDTGKVPLEKIPESLKSDFMRQYGSEGGTLKLPLEASYLLLNGLADPVGEHFQQMHEEFRSVQIARNSSWLAHGTNTVREDTYRKLQQLTLTLCEVAAEELPSFPKLSWRVGAASGKD